jgi:retron-type reverse transcriptase
MKRVGNLWPALTSFENLLAAALAAASGKRGRPEVAAYLLNLETNVIRLRRELLDGTYRTGSYRDFLVHESKPRLISAAPFRDRVVHHALTQIVEPVFERRFTADSFASRAGFGTHRALARAAAASARFPLVLKCDVMKYFHSIDHEILQGLLERALKCPPTLALAAQIVGGWTAPPRQPVYFGLDGLFSPLERRAGLPLGNQTSQFFANVYLNGLDHFVRRELRPGEYLRYVDDFLLFGQSKDELREMRARIEERLALLRLRIHPGKSRVYRTGDGLSFLGWRLFPDRSRLDRGNVARFRRRLRRMREEYKSGRMSGEDITRRVQAWIGHARHGDTWRLRESLFDTYDLQRCAV